MQYQGPIHIRIQVCPQQSLENTSQESPDLINCAVVLFLDGQKQ